MFTRSIFTTCHKKWRLSLKFKYSMSAFAIYALFSNVNSAVELIKIYVDWERKVFSAYLRFVHLRSFCVYLLLNFQLCRHMGHCWLTVCDWSHLTMQCMWKQCEHWPQTNGQSSPGNLQSGQQPSKGIRQIPQLSSLATHFQVAIPVHSEIFQRRVGFKIWTFFLTFSCLLTFNRQFHSAIGHKRNSTLFVYNKRYFNRF